MFMFVLQRLSSYRELNKRSKERRGPTLGVRFTEVSVHRRTGIFLPGGAVNHLPKKFSQVARIFPNRTVEKKRGPYDATTEAALAYEGGAIL